MTNSDVMLQSSTTAEFDVMCPCDAQKMHRLCSLPISTRLWIFSHLLTSSQQRMIKSLRLCPAPCRTQFWRLVNILSLSSAPCSAHTDGHYLASSYGQVDLQDGTGLKLTSVKMLPEKYLQEQWGYLAKSLFVLVKGTKNCIAGQV